MLQPTPNARAIQLPQAHGGLQCVAFEVNMIQMNCYHYSMMKFHCMQQNQQFQLNLLMKMINQSLLVDGMEELFHFTYH